MVGHGKAVTVTLAATRAAGCQFVGLVMTARTLANASMVRRSATANEMAQNRRPLQRLEG